MRKYLSSFDVSVVKIWDDHVENVKIADKLANEYESVKFMKYLIVNGRIKYLGTLN